MRKETNNIKEFENFRSAKILESKSSLIQHETVQKILLKLKFP